MSNCLLSYTLINYSNKLQAEQLESVFEPNPIGFSFNTPAWYVLWVVLVIIITYGIYKLAKKHKQNAYRRLALQAINNIKLESNQTLNTLKIVLKQVAITKYGRDEVAALYGKNWLTFLESKAKNTPFTKHPILIKNEFKINKSEDKEAINALLILSKKWINEHS